ncbi:MAG: ribonuclease domain-containing protein [Marmoricola sp.]
MSQRTRGLLALVGILVVLVVLLWSRGGGPQLGGEDDSRTPGTSQGASRSGSVALDRLPAQARSVVAAIRAGGPFTYDRDGVVFGNREGLLPPEPRGYYHEYTVPTPGSSDRGARRIVAGEGGELYYSGDHYRSFQQIGGAP